MAGARPSAGPDSRYRLDSWPIREHRRSFAAAGLRQLDGVSHRRPGSN